MRFGYCLLASLCLTAVAQAATPQLAWESAGDGWYKCDTGVLKAKLRLDGKSQGIASLVHSESGIETAHGALPGLLGPYRVFSTDTRYGDAARDWPTRSRLLSDGTVEARWPASDEHPLEIVAIYRLQTADSIQIELAVTPPEAMPGFELFLASYFPEGFNASVYCKPNRFSGDKPALIAADCNPLVDSAYLMFPRDRESLKLIFDRRWLKEPNPVDWAFTRYLAAPIGVRRDNKSGIAVAVMAPADDCFAVSTPYNKTPADGVSSHSSLYLSLVGRDVAAGETAKAKARLIVGRNLTDEQIITRYESMLKETARR